MPINADLPEEYAWALQHQGRRPRLDAANLPSFLEFCRDVTVCQDPARPLLLKNPFDVANSLFMARTFPAARFVHIHRNPVDVINSQVRAVRSLLAQKNEYVALLVRRYRALYERPAALAAVRFFYSPRWPVLVTQVARNVARSNDYILRHRKVLADRQLSLTYDDLCVRPAETMARILSFVGARLASTPDYAALIRPRESVLLDEVVARRTRIRARNADYCRWFGV
jgi:hypothetical protein